jgi:hypothetical protein
MIIPQELACGVAPSEEFTLRAWISQHLGAWISQHLGAGGGEVQLVWLGVQVIYQSHLSFVHRHCSRHVSNLLSWEVQGLRVSDTYCTKR